MWILRMLTGPMAGRKFELRDGANRLGRADVCEIPVRHNGISKEHAVFKVSGDEVELVDNNSSNGVYVNGIRIRSRRLHNGDRIGFSDVVADVHEIRGVRPQPRLQIVNEGSVQTGSIQTGMDSSAAVSPGTVPATSAFAAASAIGISLASTSTAEHPERTSGSQAPHLGPTHWWTPVASYIETAVLPGIYRLGENGEFKWVLGGFILLFAVLVTVLATIPLVDITQSSIEQESHLRALGLAEHLADRFSQGLQSGSVANVNFDSILRQKGVRSAYVVASNDGHIVAPGAKAGTFPQESFVNQARVRDQRFTININSTTLGSSVPISQFNAERGRFEPQYDAIVIYEVSGISFDDGRVISLFVKVLTIALLAGGVLYFFLYRFVLYPVTSLSQSLDRALVERHAEIKSIYQFPEMSKLIESVNALLARAGAPQSDSGSAQFSVDRTSEVTNLVHTIPASCCAVWGDGRILAVNHGFGDITGVREDYYRDKPITSLTDHSLTLNMEELMTRASQSPSMMPDSQIVVSDRDFRLSCQVFMNESGPEYFLFFISSAEGNP